MTFTVVIPVYGVERYLRACLDSVLEAARRVSCPVEIICVDDGSPDGSGAILDEYVEKVEKLGGGGQRKEDSDNDAERTPRLRVIHQANAGVSAARNRGIEEAKGEWIVFVDGDDLVSSNIFSYLAGRLTGFAVDFLMYGNTETTESSGTPDCAECPSIIYDLSTDDGVLAACRATQNLLVWNACYRRTLIGDVRFQPIPSGEDSLFATMMLVRSRSVAVTATQLYIYRRRADSATGRTDIAFFESSILSLKLRVGALRAWSRYRSALPYVRKLSVTTAGQLFERMRRLSAHDHDESWRAYVDMGRFVFRGHVPYCFAFAVGTRSLIGFLIYRQYILRRAVARLRMRLHG